MTRGPIWILLVLVTTSPATARLAGLPLVGKDPADEVLHAVGLVGGGARALRAFNF